MNLVRIMKSRLNSLIRYPERIPCDKRLHFMLGVVYMAIACVCTDNHIVQVGCMVAFGYGIEFAQRETGSGKFEHWDALAVIAGGTVVFLSHYFR